MNQIEEATDLVKSIPTFLEAVSGVLQTSFGWVVLLGLIIWVVINRDPGKILTFFENRKSKRISLLERFWERGDVSGADVATVISDTRETYYFRLATGIYAENNKRAALIKLHNKVSLEISWDQIKRAMPYIEFSSGNPVRIKPFTKWDNAGYYYNISVAFISLFFSIALFLATLFAANKTVDSVLLALVGSALCFAFALFVMAQNWPHESASRIRKALSRIMAEG